MVEKALSRLRQAHPEILFTGDYANVGHFALPENMQEADHHLYTRSVQKALLESTGTWLGDQVPPRIQKTMRCFAG